MPNWEETKKKLYERANIITWKVEWVWTSGTEITLKNCLRTTPSPTSSTLDGTAPG